MIKQWKKDSDTASIQNGKIIRIDSVFKVRAMAADDYADLGWIERQIRDIYGVSVEKGTGYFEDTLKFSGTDFKTLSLDAFFKDNFQNEYDTLYVSYYYENDKLEKYFVSKTAARYHRYLLVYNIADKAMRAKIGKIIKHDLNTQVGNVTISSMPTVRDVASVVFGRDGFSHMAFGELRDAFSARNTQNLKISIYRGIIEGSGEDEEIQDLH